MNRLFLLPGTTRRDPAVDAWMDARDGELGALARRWFETLRGCGDDVREILHDGRPTACVGEAAFAYVDAYTFHVNVGFFRGAELEDPTGLLEGAGKRMRHVKLQPDDEIDDEGLKELVLAAHRDMRERVRGA
ncbi:MAG: DUF1801 domain-containing protein [Planctomycetota bacterium JB042]